MNKPSIRRDIVRPELLSLVLCLTLWIGIEESLGVTTYFQEVFTNGAGSGSYLTNCCDDGTCIDDTTYHFVAGGDTIKEYIGAPYAHPDSTSLHNYPGGSFNNWDGHLSNDILVSGGWDGGGALQITYSGPDGNGAYHYGFPMSYYLRGAKFYPNNHPYINKYRAHATELDEAYLSYKLKFDATFDSSGSHDTGKLPGLAGTRTGGGGSSRSNGLNGWSARLGWEQKQGGGANKDTIAIFGYIYHKNQRYDFGDFVPTIDKDAPRLLKGQWYDIKTWVKMNSINATDGHFKLWVNGVLRVHAWGNWIWVYNSSGQEIRSESLAPYGIEYSDSTTIKINRIWADMYYGEPATVPNTSYIYLDAMRMDDLGIELGPAPKPVLNTTYLLPSNSILLEQNSPNPFNPETAIYYTLLSQGSVELKVYNLAGQEVRTLVNDVLSAGRYQVVWDGRSNSGVKVSSGIYLYQLKAEGVVRTRKMILLH